MNSIAGLCMCDWILSSLLSAFESLQFLNILRSEFKGKLKRQHSNHNNNNNNRAACDYTSFTILSSSILIYQGNYSGGLNILYCMVITWKESMNIKFGWSRLNWIIVIRNICVHAPQLSELKNKKSGEFSRPSTLYNFTCRHRKVFHPIDFSITNNEKYFNRIANNNSIWARTLPASQLEYRHKKYRCHIRNG